MESAVTETQSFDHREPIPGYVLREKIGSGGYGEVWQADAPGGLSKAVKIIFGQATGSRAQRELKSLNRMKQVQHPFLLSLERIEIVDGHLVIVSELAEESVQDRFDAYCDQGLPGIPRDELLGYLRDAADALDYLYETQGLQHLDVKPENLLLLSRHVKVADFGLAKHVDDVEASMIGGLTPLYASPEMFDGRPNPHSDQYSLAIVFQQMLTGAPPFAGRTTAQLAAQHLNSQPDLSSLPEPDRRTVARALHKNPEKRFSNCRAFVESLLNPETFASLQGRRTSSETATTRDKRLPPAAAGQRPSATSVQRTEALELLSCERAVENLPRLELPPQAAVSYRPTIVIGLGGSAVEALRLLRMRWSHRFGKLESVPAFRLLALDTDSTALTNRTSENDRESLQLAETMALPLCDSRQYRGRSKSLLEWMNRRWLYNIPRSLRTEGIRPLGRLAFIDHFDAIRERLQCAIASAVSEDAIQQSTENTGLNFLAGPPRLLVVSSTNGGTGSGAVADLAYTVRMVLKELGVSDRELIGLLMHSTNRRASARDLAISNTLSCLSELRHFAGPQGFYPGEPACGIEAFRTDSAAFRQLYFVHLGDQLDQTGLDQGIAKVADYLYQSTASSASRFFDHSRHDGREHDLGEPSFRLRSFGLVRLRNSLNAACQAAGGSLCHLMVKKWIVGPDAIRAEKTVRLADTKALVAAQSPQRSGMAPRISQMAVKLVAALQLEAQSLVTRAREFVSSELGSPEAYLRQLINDARARLEFYDRPAANPQAAQQIMETIDAVLIGHHDQSEDGGHETVQSMLDARLDPLVSQLKKAVRLWLHDLVDDPGMRIRSGADAMAWLREHIESEQASLQDVRKRLDTQIHILERRLASGREAPASTARGGRQDDQQGDSVFLQLGELRLDQVAHRSVAFALRDLNIALTENLDRLDATRDRLQALTQQLEDPSVPQASSEKSTSAETSVNALLGESLYPVLGELDRRLEQTFFTQRFRLSALVEATSEEMAELVAVMGTIARQTVTEAVFNSDSGQSAEETGDDLTNVQTLRECLRQARPEKMSHWGGAQRLLLSGPHSWTQRLQTASQLVKQLEDYEPTIVTSEEEDTVLCYELQDIPLKHVMQTLVGARREYLDIASKVHTRIDVDWPRLVL